MCPAAIAPLCPRGTAHMTALPKRVRPRHLALVAALGLAAPLVLVAVASATLGANDYGAGFEVFEDASEVTLAGVDPSSGSVNLTNDATNNADDWVASADGN